MAEMLIGVSPTQTDTTAQFTLGTETKDPRARDFPMNELRYVKAGSAISAGNTCTVSLADADEPFTLVPASALNQVVAGVAVTAIASGSFGWVTIKGRVASALKTASTVTAGDPMSTTATAGALAIANSTSATALAVGSGIGIQALDSSDSNSTTIEVVLV
jgi:hypothetical protein